MRRIMTMFLPILLAVWVAAGVANILTSGDGAASLVAFWLALPVAWIAMLPVAGFLGGLVGFEPRRMNNLYGGGWQAGMRVARRPGRWHHT